MSPRTPTRCRSVPIALAALAPLLASGCERGEGAGSKSDPSVRDPTAASAPRTGEAKPGTLGVQASSSQGSPVDDAVEVALGPRQSCLLSKNGAVYCFEADLVARKTGVDAARQLAVVDDHLCVLSPQGKLACVEIASGKRTELPIYRDGIVLTGGRHGFAVRTEDGVLRGGVIDPQRPEPKPPSGMPGLSFPATFALGAALGCATLEHALWCWNTEKGHGLPALMTPIPLARHVAVGRERICVDTDSGELWCYPADRKAKPSRLEGWTGVTALSIAYGDAERDRLCALDEHGSVSCARLEGEGEAALFSAPTPVAGLPRIARFGAGDSPQSCAVGLEGELWCWGPERAEPAQVRRALDKAAAPKASDG